MKKADGHIAVPVQPGDADGQREGPGMDEDLPFVLERRRTQELDPISKALTLHAVDAVEGGLL